MIGFFDVMEEEKVKKPLEVCQKRDMDKMDNTSNGFSMIFEGLCFGDPSNGF